MKITIQPHQYQSTINHHRSFLNGLRELQAEFPNNSAFTDVIETTQKSLESLIAMQAPRPLKQGAMNMQLNCVDMSGLADLLQDSEKMQILVHEGQLIYVLHYGGGDVLAIANPITGGATCIYPSASVDDADDQARLQRV
jgi:hypothetical protein